MSPGSKRALVIWLVLWTSACSGSVIAVQAIDGGSAATGSSGLSISGASSGASGDAIGVAASGASAGMAGASAGADSGADSGAGAESDSGADSGADAGADAPSEDDDGGPPDLTEAGTPIALITHPTGAGNYDINVIRDGVFPPRGSMDPTQQYDTYNGTFRTEDWIGYAFTSPQIFGSLVFQEGMKFHDGGWFITLAVQVRQNGVWIAVPNAAASPPYAGDDGVNYGVYRFSFPPIVGTGIRIDGTPGGSSTFISVGELRAYGAP
jgi:hypothetical protein